MKLDKNDPIYKNIRSSSKVDLLIYLINPNFKDYIPLIEYQLDDKSKQYWIDDLKIPSDFNSMDDFEKWNYICKNKLLHRENGPAVIYSDGSKYWYLNGKKHRLNGPAIIFGYSEIEWYYLNGVRVDEEIYKKIEGSSKEKLLMYAVLPKYKDYLSLIEYRLGII